MTIQIEQQVDYLWKKLGYGVTKTATSDIKDATNERIPSKPFIPGNRIWTQSELIPTVIPNTTHPVVTVYNDALSSTVKCDMDLTARDNRTWLTNLTDWIPVQFGSTYQIKVYLDSANSTSPQTTGVQLWEAGSNNNDEWFFDHESGVLHFIGINLPSQNFGNKRIFISGARYTGVLGLGQMNPMLTSNITITGSTISSTDTIILAPTAGNVINANGSQITNVGYPTSSDPAVFANTVATTQYVLNTVAALHPNVIYQGDSSIRIDDSFGNVGSLTITLDGNVVSTMTSSTVTFGDININGNVISAGTNNVTIASDIFNVSSTQALKVPIGTTAERPASAYKGYIRYNSTIDQIEWYNGTQWMSAMPELIQQVIDGDGITTQFVLTREANSTNLFVIINGVVQVPNYAYDVIGNIIYFAEAPKINDQVEIRFISQAAPSLSELPATVNFNPTAIQVGITPVIVDSFPLSSCKSAKYIVSVETSDNNVITSEILLSQNGITTFIASYGYVRTGGNVNVSFDSIISGSVCQLFAQATTQDNLVQIQKFGFGI
jgi:hypothetical protein